MNDREAFSAACAVELRFGKYNGQTIARVGASDEGLLYLDWLVGQTWFARGETIQSVKTYLAHPSVSQKLDSLIP